MSVSHRGVRTGAGAGSRGPHRVVVLALPPVVGYDLTIPVQFFNAARDSAGESLYQVTVASLDPLPVPTASGGYSILAAVGPESLAVADTVIIPGTHLIEARRDGVLPDEVTAALATIASGARVMSICTGAFVLAAAGLLDGRRATTHWQHSASFRRLFPAVELDEDVLWVDEGEVLTSAGLSAGVDLCLHVIRRDHGAAVANRVARSCVVPPFREGGQAQFIERPLPEAGRSGSSKARQWAVERLAEGVDVTAMARQASQSVRTFARHFVAETGVTPGVWLVQQRVQRARQLLESTDWSVDRIAAECGYGTGAALRLQLRRQVGLAPEAYRRTFRAA